MRSISPALLIRRAARITASPSTSRACGKVAMNNCSNRGVRPSTPIRSASERPGMAATVPMMFAGFQLIGYRHAGEISAGTPKSVTLIRWTAPVSRTTTQPGANGRVPDSQRRVASDTNRALPSRPSTSTSTSCLAISASARASPSATRSPVAGAQPFVPVVGYRDDLLGPEARLAVVPHDRLEHQHHARCQHERVVEVVAEVGPDEGHLGAVRADAVGEVQVREPRATPLVPACGAHEVPGGRARLEDVETAIDDLAPAHRLVAMARLGPAYDEGATKVGRVSLVLDAGVDPDHVARRELPVGRRRREHDVTGGGVMTVRDAVRHDLPDGVHRVRGRTQLEDAAQKGTRLLGPADAGRDEWLDREHGFLVERLGTANALELVGRLDDLARAQERRRVRDLASVQRGMHRHRVLVERGRPVR